jgi:twitching motility two-component system response regulator PilH
MRLFQVRDGHLHRARIADRMNHDPRTADSEAGGEGGGLVMGKKVLVVDDDPDVRLFSTTVLEENGYLPLEAENGEEGLRMIKSEKPDLVILDVLMPRQSGIRLFRQLKIDAALKDVKVLILSGIAKKTFLRSQQALTEFGEGQVPEPEFYIEKPVDAEVLASTIKKALE